MYDLFESMGFAPTIVCEYLHGDLGNRRVVTRINPSTVNRYGLMIYHHSTYYKRAEPPSSWGRSGGTPPLPWGRVRRIIRISRLDPDDLRRSGLLGRKGDHPCGEGDESGHADLAYHLAIAEAALEEMRNNGESDDEDAVFIEPDEPELTPEEQAEESAIFNADQ